MTIINVNSISGISSITAQGASGIEFFDSSGSSVQKVTGDGLTVGTGATISGSTNTITASTNGEERVRITSGGGVLIGGHTSAVDVGNAPNIEIVNTSTSTLTLARNDTSIASGNDIASIRVWGNDSNGTYQQCAEILAEADGDHGTGDKPTALSFKVSADGASSPTERLRIGSDGASAFTSDSSTRTATFTGNGVEVIHSAGSNIFFGTQTGTDGKIGTENNANLHLYANGYGNRITVDTSGNLSIVDGDLVVANGHGIDFSATAGSGISAGGGILDDYEEGTWSPVGNVALSGAISSYYIKIGRFVTVTTRITFPTSSNTATVNISSLPFAVDDNLSNSAMANAVGETNYTGSDRPVACVETSDVIRFRIAGQTAMTYANLSGKNIRFSVSYFSAS
jgi:hypothetical protein